HRRIVLVPLLQIAQYREDVHAVDAAIRPKIEQDQLPAQVADGERPVDVQPGGRPCQVGCMDALAHALLPWPVFDGQASESFQICAVTPGSDTAKSGPKARLGVHAPGAIPARTRRTQASAASAVN